MTDCKQSADSKVVIPIRTISNPSPPKKTASNQHLGQTYTRTKVDEVITHELAKARYLMHDLADHVLGHIVLTKLARDILHEFVHGKVIQVFKATGPVKSGSSGLKSNRGSSREMEVSHRGGAEV